MLAWTRPVDKIRYPGPVLLTKFTYKVWDEINYPIPNFSGTTVEIREWISNFIPHFNGHVMTDPFWDKKYSKYPVYCFGLEHSEFLEISRDLVNHFELRH